MDAVAIVAGRTSYSPGGGVVEAVDTTRAGDIFHGGASMGCSLDGRSNGRPISVMRLLR
jgi:sugar/nucleoside kinase (ribokinase family)